MWAGPYPAARVAQGSHPFCVDREQKMRAQSLKRGICKDWKQK